jgi:hypothetical protein
MQVLWFPSWHQVVNEVLLNVVTKTKEKYVLQVFASYIRCITSFDFWMLYVSYKMLTMVVSFIKFLGAHACDSWNFWSAKYSSCSHGKLGKNYTWFIWFVWQSHYLCQKQRFKFQHIDQCLQVCNFLFSLSSTSPISRIMCWPCNVKGSLVCFWWCQSLLGCLKS